MIAEDALRRLLILTALMSLGVGITTCIDTGLVVRHMWISCDILECTTGLRIDRSSCLGDCIWNWTLAKNAICSPLPVAADQSRSRLCSTQKRAAREFSRSAISTRPTPVATPTHTPAASPPPAHMTSLDIQSGRSAAICAAA